MTVLRFAFSISFNFQGPNISSAFRLRAVRKNFSYENFFFHLLGSMHPSCNISACAELSGRAFLAKTSSRSIRSEFNILAYAAMFKGSSFRAFVLFRTRPSPVRRGARPQSAELYYIMASTRLSTSFFEIIHEKSWQFFFQSVRISPSGGLHGRLPKGARLYYHTVEHLSRTFFVLI